MSGAPWARACLAWHKAGGELPDNPRLPPALRLLAEDPELAQLAVLLTEADILASVGLSVAYGEFQQQLLARERGEPLGATDKLNFIENVFTGFRIGEFFMPNVDQIRQAMRQKVATEEQEA